jgi:hypothetical protein
MFLFSSATGYAPRSLRFEGVAIPGSLEPNGDWCVSKMFSLASGEKFENYVFSMTILADGHIRREWLQELVERLDCPEACPFWYRNWIRNGTRVPLTIR